MISVVIPTFNVAHCVARAVRSAMGQNIDEELEVIVVDDCSTDSTIEVVRDMADARIRILEQTCNQGAGAARQRGILEARGRYLAFLDSDDFWLDGFLRKTAEFLDEHPEAVAVSVGQEHRGVGCTAPVLPAFLRDGRARQATVIDDFFPFWSEHDHICTGSVMVRTRVAQDLGGMRQDLRVMEDLEFWGLLATCGRWGFIPEILFVADGRVGCPKDGWVSKSMPRWMATPTVEEWAKRIQARLSVGEKAKFSIVEGMIGRQAAMGMILSGRDALAREQVRRHGGLFPCNFSSRIMKNASVHLVTWKVLCWALRRKEYSRRVAAVPLGKEQFVPVCDRGSLG